MTTRAERTMWIAAGICFAAGVLSVAWAVRDIHAAIPRLERRKVELRRAMSIEKRMEMMRAARRDYAARPAGKAETTWDVFKETVGGHVQEAPRRTSRDLGNGMTLRQEEFAVSEVAVARVMEYFRRIEKLPAPWRLTKCTIRTTGETPGTANVVVKVEVIEKNPDIL